MARGEYYMDDAPISDDGVFGTEGMKGVNVADNPPATSLSSLLNSTSTIVPVRGKAFTDQRNDRGLTYGHHFTDESKYDEDIVDLSRLDDGYTVNQLRGEVQSGAAQLGAGLAKAGVLAGTTLAEGIVGTIYSIGAAAYTGKWSALFDNEFTNFTQSINDWSEEYFKIFETKEEEEAPWYKKFYKASFIGDNVLKNMGFMVGAAYSGRIGVAGLSKLAGLNKIRNTFKGAANASGKTFKTIQDAVKAVENGEDIYLNGQKISRELRIAAMKLKHALPVQKITGAFLGALGESRFEANNNSGQYADKLIQEHEAKFEGIQNEELAALQKEAPQMFSYQRDAGGGFVLVPNEDAISIAKGRALQKFDYEGGLAKIEEARVKMGMADYLMNIPLLTVSDLWQFGKFYAGGYNNARRTANIIKKVTDGKISYAAPQRGWGTKSAKVLQKGMAEGPVEEMGQSTIAKTAELKYGSELNEFYGSKIDPEAEEKTQGWIKSTGQAIASTYGDIDNWSEAFVGGISGMLGVPSVQWVKSKTGKLQSPLTFKGGALEDIREIKEQDQAEAEMVNALNARMQSPEFLNYYQGMIRHNKYQSQMDEAVNKGDAFEFKNAEHSQFISDVMLFENAGRLNDLIDIIDEAGTVSDEDIEQIRQLTTDPISGKSIYENKTNDEIREGIKEDTEYAKYMVDRYKKLSSNLQILAGTERTSDELEELTWMLTKIDDWEYRFEKLHEDVKENLKEIILESGNIILDSKNNLKVSDLLNIPTSELMSRLASSPEAFSIFQDIDSIKKDKSLFSNSLTADITDLARVAKARQDFVYKYNDYINNPEKLTKSIAATIAATSDEIEKATTKDLRERIESAQNMDELNEILNNETDEEATNKVLEKLREEGNPLIQQKDEYDSLVDDIQTNLDEITPDDETLADANALLDELISRGGNLEDLTNSIIEGNFDPETLQDEDRLVKAAYVIQDSLARALQAKKLKESIGEIELPTDEDVDDEDSLVPPTRPYQPPVGDITPEELREGNKGYIPNAQGEFLVPAISEFHIDAQREGDFRPFPIVELEKSGRDYTTIYSELEERGAFDYVNNGELHEGDEIKFMIDPAFEAKVENNPVFTKPTIFMVKEVDGRNQVVGVLPVAAKYKGTTELQSRVIEGYNKSDKTEQYVAPDTTKVSKIMVGRVPSGDEMRPLSEIPGVGTKPLFGIMKGGRIVTGNNDVEIEQPQDVTDKDGRLYLMIPAPNGKSRPSYVRVKHFNNKEYDLSDPKNVSTPLYDNLSIGLNAVASAKSQAELDEAVATLSETVYTGDLFFDLVGGEKGTFIRITKVYRDERGNYIYEAVDGEQVLKKSKPEFIKLEEALPFASLDTSGRTMAAEAPAERTIENIQAELTKKLMKFNQPFQVSVNKINKGSYNEYLINSGVLTSDITEARYRGSFFMADPFEPDGTTRRANIPSSPKPSTGKKAENSVGGKETVLKGTRVTLGNEEYSVDNDTIYDKNGQVVKPENSDIIKAIAYVERTYGDSKNGVNMVDGVVLIGNRVFDSNTNTFLEGKAVKQFKDSLKPSSEPAPGASPTNNENKEGANNTSTQESGKEAELAERLNKINEAQARVDMGNSTRDKYMVLEDDGQYHEYKNVDTVLGPNWIEKPEVSEKLKGIEAELFNRSETPEEFNKYLKSLQAIYSIDLSSFENKTDSNSRDEIVGVMRDTLNNTNSQRAIKAKTAIDGIIDSFFNDPTKAVERPENLSEESYNGLISSLTRIKDQLDSKGDTVVGTNMVVYHTFPDGAKIAGTVDVVIMDKDGNFKFLDIKSSRYSFHDFIGNNGKKMNFFEGKSRFQNMSSREYFTDQMSMAKNIFESQFGMPVSSMGILPFVMDYSKDDNTTVDKLVMEKGIPLKYNPSVKVPVVSQPEKTSTEEPIFNSILETRSPVDMTEDVSKMEGSKVGYYINSDGNLVKGNLVLGGTIEGSKVYFVRELVDQVSMKKHFQDYTYKAVFENGKSLTVAKHVGLEREVPFELFMSLLNSNLEKVMSAMSASTIISDFNSKMDSSIEKSVNKLNAAKGTIGKRRPKFRLANRTEKKMNIKEEFAWLKEVLPGLSSKDRLKVQKGLITVAEKGAQAWGQYENGVITLSDIAAEGTLYHEAFHAVFDLMASPEERENMLREARERWGDLSEEGLEEKLAEEFRIYTMGVRVKSLGKRILDFFKTLWYKVSNWNRIKPYTYSFYQKINEGRFSEMSETALRAPKESMRFEELRRGVKNMLEAKGWTSEMWDKISDMEKKHAIKCASL